MRIRASALGGWLFFWSFRRHECHWDISVRAYGTGWIFQYILAIK
jgi:hypothetical protein